MSETPRDAARRQAEEALANFERFVFIGGPAHPDKPYHDAGVNLATALRALLAAAREAEAALAEEREKLAKAERRGEKAAVALARAHEVIAQQRSLIDPEEYPEIDAAAGEVIDPCDEFADRMDRAEADVRTLTGERDRLRTQLAREREARQAAEEEIARHPRRCTAEKKCEPCLSEERAWAETEKAESALAEERRRREEAEAIIRRILDAHDARLSERGHLVYGHPSMGTGFPEAIRFLAGAPAPQPAPMHETDRCPCHPVEHTFADHFAKEQPAPLTSSSTVSTTDPPAAPLPTCQDCGSNFVHPQPAPMPEAAPAPGSVQGILENSRPAPPSEARYCPVCRARGYEPCRQVYGEPLDGKHAARRTLSAAKGGPDAR